MNIEYIKEIIEEIDRNITSLSTDELNFLDVTKEHIKRHNRVTDTQEIWICRLHAKVVNVQA